MKKSLSTRLMYSYMTVIVIIVVGITAGISYLIADYFFKIKEQELSQKGHEMSETIEYFVRMNDHSTLSRYILAVDRLVGARIWLFDDNYGLLAASYVLDQSQEHENGNDESILDFFRDNELNNNLKVADGTDQLEHAMKQSDMADKVKVILNDIYAGKSFQSQIFHPYYKEHVILVGVPYLDPLTGNKGAILMTEPLSGFERFLRNVYIYVIIVGIIAIIFSLFLVRRLSRIIIMPVEKMKDVAKAMASGDYSKRVEVMGEDEIAELGEALNSLGKDLDEYVAKMERTEKIRRDFVANVSHELRTPITIIRGYNEAINDGMVTDKEMLQRYRGLINDETIRLERMVRELLDISRLESRDPLTVNNIILGNGDQMVQLILILCDNALKYSPKNGTVSVCANKVSDGSVLVTVSDQGEGIPAEEIPFIWERFYKVEKSHCRRVPGTGLGLAIAKEIIRMHGASTEVISECGVGTTFEIKFPKDKVV